MAAGVEVVVPTSEASTPIGDLESRTRRARAAVAAALGVAPMPVTVRLYDTIDGFRVATSRPWWVAFDRRMSSIALGPVAAADADTLDAIDRLLFQVFTRGWQRKDIERYAERLRIEKDDGPISPAIGRTLQSIDGKAAALLTYTSMMVAALGVINGPTLWGGIQRRLRP